MRKILIIDNYDSFVYNIYQYIGELDKNAEIAIFRNDKIKAKQIREMNPTHIVISPGPGHPRGGKQSLKIIKQFSSSIPTLGVCLGHQIGGLVFGAKIIHAKRIIHGKISLIHHSERGIFKDILNPFYATRYHSLVIDEGSLPDCFTITAKSDLDQEIMAIEHRDYPFFGVQFHPESICTQEGKNVLTNFLNLEAKKSKDRFVFIKSKPSFSKDVVRNNINKLVEGKDISYQQAVKFMHYIMDGRLTDSQIASFLIALRIKGETGEEIAGMAKVMQEKAIKINTSSDKTSDTCGTGGDGAGTFNISTAVAFLASAAGIPIAKHGNRSVSSKVGSADVLEAGGYKLQKEKSIIEQELKQIKFAFLFAPLFHPAMKNVMPVRRQLKVRTVFNILGPLVNPARVKHQILGVFDYGYAPKLALALQLLGTKKSLVLSGGFTDELTTCSDNKAILVQQQDIQEFIVEPRKLGLSKGDISELKGQRDPYRAYQVMQKVLGGKASKTKIETVALNAGALFFITGKVKTLKEGVAQALDLIISGKGLAKLEEIIEYQHSFKEKRR
jgi:anthranilate synthase/phosphoribosyltransferase